MFGVNVCEDNEILICIDNVAITSGSSLSSTAVKSKITTLWLTHVFYISGFNTECDYKHFDMMNKIKTDLFIKYVFYISFTL